MKIKRLLAAFVLFLALPTVIRADVIIPIPATVCITLRDSGDKCTWLGSIQWWLLDCENVLVNPGDPCEG